MPVEIEEASSQTPVTALLARLSSHTAKVGVIGLGYVGLTIAVELAPTRRRMPHWARKSTDPHRHPMRRARAAPSSTIR